LAGQADEPAEGIQKPGIGRGDTPGRAQKLGAEGNPAPGQKIPDQPAVKIQRQSQIGRLGHLAADAAWFGQNVSFPAVMVLAQIGQNPAPQNHQADSGPPGLLSHLKRMISPGRPDSRSQNIITAFRKKTAELGFQSLLGLSKLAVPRTGAGSHILPASEKNGWPKKGAF
jgi:hypothetical protein